MKQNNFIDNKPIYEKKLYSLLSTLDFLNKANIKYAQKDILYYFNKSLQRINIKPVALRTLQRLIAKLRDLGFTTNYVHRNYSPKGFKKELQFFIN